MCSAVAERDASFGRDVWIRRLMRASRESGTHDITATEGSNITFAACGKNITYTVFRFAAVLPVPHDVDDPAIAFYKDKADRAFDELRRTALDTERQDRKPCFRKSESAARTCF
jgi:hypothetical protein